MLDFISLCEQGNGNAIMPSIIIELTACPLHVFIRILNILVYNSKKPFAPDVRKRFFIVFNWLEYELLIFHLQQLPLLQHAQYLHQVTLTYHGNLRSLGLSDEAL